MATWTTTIDSGTVAGVARPHGGAFYGIPYAAAPFGPHRLAAPAPVAPWDGTRPATEPAPTAPQPGVGFTLIPEPVIDGGDTPGCLVVNVFTPDLGAAGLPVLVWIHGGGFVTGTPSSTWYDGGAFVRDGVVVVSVGYRLGAEGFLDIEGAAPNRAVQDWLAALAWVQRNIAAFGGDPARVTVGGQSAGGAAATLLSTLPQGPELFRAVIPMSGSVFPASKAADTRALTDAIAAHLGISPTLDAFRGVRPADLVAAQSSATTGDDEKSLAERLAGGLNFFPYVDGEIVTQSPLDAISAGVGADLPMLVGTTHEEFTALARFAPLPADQEAEALARLGLGPDGVAAYQHDGGLGQAGTDAIFRLPAGRLADARVGAPAPTFHYEFCWATSALGGLGSVHCLDLPFVFDVLSDPHVAVVAGDDPPQVLADTMHRAWVDFVTAGDPGWAPYDHPRRTGMAFDTTSKPVDDILGPTRALWP